MIVVNPKLIVDYQLALDRAFEAYRAMQRHGEPKLGTNGQYVPKYQQLVRDFVDAAAEVSITESVLLTAIRDGRPRNEFQMYARMNPGEE